MVNIDNLKLLISLVVYLAYARSVSRYKAFRFIEHSEKKIGTAKHLLLIPFK